MSPPRRTPRRRLAALALAPTLFTIGACQTYEPAPLDVRAHADAFATRSLDAEPLRAFALRLAEPAQATTTFDPSDGITVEEGQAIALFYNADLRNARTAAGITRATADNAGKWEDPELGFDAAEILSASSPLEWGITLGLTLPISGRLAAERDRAGAEHEAELRRLADAEWRTRTHLREAWATWSAAREQRVLLTELLTDFDAAARITTSLVNAGELPRTEGRLLDIDLASRRAELLAAQAREREARLELLEVMGLPPGADVDLIPTLSTPPHPHATDDRIINHNTSLAIRRADYHTAEQTLRAEVRKQYPDLSIAGGYGEEDDRRLLLGLSIPIPILNANAQGIAQARAQRDAARSAVYTEYEALAHRLASLTTRLDAARQQREAYAAAIVPLLDDQLTDLDNLAQLGEVDVLLLTESIDRRANAKETLIDLRLTESTIANQLRELLGPDEPQAPAPIDPPADEAGEATP